MADTKIRIPYNLEEADMVLEPNIPLNVKSVVRSRLTNYGDDEIERVIRGTAALYENTGEGAGIWACLYTAMIWERG